MVAKMSQQGDGLGQWLALSPEEAHPEVCPVPCHGAPCAMTQAFSQLDFGSRLGCLWTCRYG